MVDFECHGDLDHIINSVFPYHRGIIRSILMHIGFPVCTQMEYVARNIALTVPVSVKCLAITDYTQIAIKYIYYEKKV